MKRGNTYPITIGLEGVDLSGADWIRITVKGTGIGVLEKTENDILVSYDSSNNMSYCTFRLTEEQSVHILGKWIDVDCNWMLNGYRGGMYPEKLQVTDTLLTEVVSNGN